MKSKSDQNPSKYIPSWQIERMQSIIEDRWHEVWQIAQARDSAQKSSKSFVCKSESNYSSS
ncbi:MAG: hypothetical protein AAFQ80_20430 [Cyanobacteria bacterium J06621_8]